MTKIEELKDYTIKVLVRMYSEANKKNIERYVNRSMITILKDVLPIAVSSVRHVNYADDESVHAFNSTQYRKNWKQVSINSKQVDTPGMLTPILFEVLEKGHSDVATAIRIKDRTMDALMEYAIEQDDDTQWVQKFDFVDVDVFETPIDVQSLRKYAVSLEENITHIVNIKEKARGLRNLCVSKAILASLTTTAGSVLFGKQQPDIQVLLQEANTADSGRLYLKGLNLQGCAKDVRHAALGHCHLYDMRAGVFGVMAGLAKAYCKSATGKDIEFHIIKDYVRHRNEVRARITRELWPIDTKQYPGDKKIKSFHGFKKVKEALTAISFGAKRTGNASWKDAKGRWKSTSLRETFEDPVRVELFLQLPVVKNLLDEFKQVSDIVLLQLEQDEVFASNFPLEGLNKSQKLAMVYQGTESRILSELLEHISDYEVLLPVHDGVYVKRRFNNMNVHYKMHLPFGIDKSYVQFEHSQIGLAMPDDHEANHRHAIFLEGITAAGHVPVHSTIGGGSAIAGRSNQVMTNWGLVDADVAPIDTEKKKVYKYED